MRVAQLGDAADVAGVQRGTSMRSRPCATERWFSFSRRSRVALNSSSPLVIAPEKSRKNVTSPTCGSDVVLKTCATTVQVVVRVDLDGLRRPRRP